MMHEIKGECISAPITGVTKVIVRAGADSKPLAYTAKQGETFKLSNLGHIGCFTGLISSITGPVVVFDGGLLIKYEKEDRDA